MGGDRGCVCVHVCMGDWPCTEPAKMCLLHDIGLREQTSTSILRQTLRGDGDGDTRVRWDQVVDVTRQAASPCCDASPQTDTPVTDETT